MRYQFEDYVLDTEIQELSCNGQGIDIEPQVFALLELLVACAERVVSKTEIWKIRIRLRSRYFSLVDEIEIYTSS